ncbi:MAG TPA: DUF4293 domain-containing protein [Flavobacteriales bacterium]|jgi:hypothetical protein|nr:DUF4293 domain-containing protein [Flavobacteriales bacterium]
MLQRKQTVFLLLAVLCGALTFAFPVASYVRGEQVFLFRTTGLTLADGSAVPDGVPRVPFAVVIGLCMAVFTAAIFFFKKRQRQMRLVRSAYLVTLTVVAFLFIVNNSIVAYLKQGGDVTTRFGASAFLPTGMLVFAFLAERYIRKDEALIKSMDRLR